ncbi:unnamed protein product [Diamesa serratosioi]
MSLNSERCYKSENTMNIDCEDVNWSDGKGVCTEIIKFKDINVTWRVTIYPKFIPKEFYAYECRNASYEPSGQYTLIKVLIEDNSNETIDYNCSFECEGDIKFKWETTFSNSKEKIMYDSSLSKVTKFIERSHEIPAVQHTNWNPLIYDKFKLTAQLAINPKLSRYFNYCSKSIIDWTELELNKPIAGTSARSPAFLACISKIISETKSDNQNPDLIELASKLLEAAKKFELLDLQEITSGFLDFHIAKENFADVLEKAINEKNDELLNLSTEFITKNQKELRDTEQWTKMKKCPIMMLNVMEKLFIEKDF